MKKFFGILVAGMMMSSCGLIDDLIGDEEEGSSDEPVATDSIAEMPEPGMDNAYRWIVERIEGEWYSETDNGERREGTAVYEFSYDEYDRVISMERRMTESGDGGEMEEVTLMSFGYGAGGMATVESFWHNGEQEYEMETDYLTNADGYVEWFSSRRVEDGMEDVTEGRLWYDEEGHVVQMEYPLDYDDDDAEWENGNLIRVIYKGSENIGQQQAWMQYGNTEWWNNPEVNVDFNWLLASSEWLGCWGFETMGVKPFDLVGRRSELLMTEEYDEFNEVRAHYMYELDGNGCPVVIQVITEEDDGSERIQAVYWITYR